MKLLKKVVIAACSILITTSVVAEPAASQKQAERATKYRQAIFSLMGSNMGTLGAMAKGKIPVDAKVVEKNAQRINQLSLMVTDYTKTDTSSFKVKTEALDKIWQDEKQFSDKANDLTLASAALVKAAMSGDEGAIKKAIGGVGKTCGGCHDVFKAE